ncbi:MAG: hypothetical protein PVG96_10790 [Desulfobacterales bacterium]|jgi:hypothetical protein
MVLPVISGAGGQWQTIVERDGITLYAREVSGHSEMQFKGICMVSRPLAPVISVLSDTASYPQWFFRCIEANKIPTKNPSQFHFLLYVAIDTPWPFADRDVLYKTEAKVDFAAGKVVIDSKALKTPLIPLKRQYVRITDSEQQWILERISVDRTRITFINRTNAAGPFSYFISNPGIRETMIHSLINLTKILKRQDHTEIIQQWDSPSDFIRLVGRPALLDSPSDFIRLVGRPALLDSPSDFIRLVGRPALLDSPSDFIGFVGHKPEVLRR